MDRGEKKSILDAEKGHYCTLLCNTPSQPPFIAFNIAQYIFPTTPFIAKQTMMIYKTKNILNNLYY